MRRPPIPIHGLSVSFTGQPFTHQGHRILKQKPMESFMAGGDQPCLICSTRSLRSSVSVRQTWRTLGGTVLELSKFWVDAPPIGRKDASLYGGVNFCRTLSARLGMELIEPPLDQLCHIEEMWLQRRVRSMELGALTPEDFPSFVKSQEHKVLPARPYKSIDEFPYKDVQELAHLEILVSDLVDFEIEMRALICKQEVVAFSPYSPENHPISPAAFRFVEDFLEENQVAIVCIVDWGRLRSGKWALVELNPVWAADPLNCDLDSFVRCLRMASYMRPELQASFGNGG